MGKRIVNFVLFLGVIGVVVIGAAILGNVTGALDLYRAQVAARHAEAEAARLQAQLDLAQAQADVTRAEGEAEVLRAAARAVDADRRLTEYYALRNDARAILALVGALGLSVTGGALYVVFKGVQDAKHNTDN